MANGRTHHLERRENIMSFYSALYSKLMRLLSTKKDCDVTIRVQDRSFPCHRDLWASASGYFNAMFGGSFMEKDARETTLHDIDAETFQEILTYVYTGEMCKIDASNSLDLLNASLFLLIHPLEVACAKFIINNVCYLRNHVEIFLLARTLNVTALIDDITLFLIVNFTYFFDHGPLLEVDFDDVSFLFGRWSKLKMPFKYENLLFHFLIRWVHHAFKERREYFIKLIAAVDFEKISPNFITFMMQYFKDFIDQQPGLEGMPPLNLPPVFEERKSTSGSLVRNWHNDTEDSKKRLCLKRKLSEYLAGDGKLSANCGKEIPASSHNPMVYLDVLGLHVYVECIGMDSVNKDRLCRIKELSESVKVFSSNEYHRDWHFSCKTNAWRNCTERRTVVPQSTNIMYCMEIFQDVNNSADRRQTFCTYSSIDLTIASSVLTSPPVHLSAGRFSMCATSPHDIYLFDSPASRYRDCELFVNDHFSAEEIDRGFYHYDCEVDKWFPAPNMKFPQNHPIICADNNLIYAIGGATSKYSNIFQSFDCRTGEWMTLPGCISNYHNGRLSNSCVVQNKVFVSSGPSSIQAYDTVAGKWQSILGLEEHGKGIKMLSHNAKLWYAYTSLCGFPDRHSISSYSPNTQKWRNFRTFDRMVSNSFSPNRTSSVFTLNRWDIKDMITFSDFFPLL